MNVTTHLKRAISLCNNSQTELARRISAVHPTQVKAQNIWAWLSRGKIPAEYCPSIEMALNGSVICEDICPGVNWGYLRGTKKRVKK